MGRIRDFIDDKDYIYDRTIEWAAFHFRLIWPYKKGERKELTFGQFYDKWMDGTLYNEKIEKNELTLEKFYDKFIDGTLYDEE